MRTRLILVALLLTTPAAAQTDDPDARFRAAQARFDRELRLFRAEFDRYQSLRRLPRSYAQPRYDDRGAGLPERSDDAPYDDRDAPPMDDRPFDDDAPQ